MSDQVQYTGKNNSGIAFFTPRHASGGPCADDCISKAVALAEQDGVLVEKSVANKFAPNGNLFNGGQPFQLWLKNQGLELCKSDKSGAWWTVVKTSDVTKRDRTGVAINANNKFEFAK